MIETLKDQRLGLYPDYDREADYATISAPWKQMMSSMWGELPQDSDSMLHTLINTNNAVEGGKMLTREGLARGNKQVISSTQSALQASFGGTSL